MEKRKSVGLRVFRIIAISLLFTSLAFAEKSREYLKYGDEEIRLDIYNPGDRNCPVVILIHGASGIEGDRATRYAGFATDLMNKGIIAINVYYFDTKIRNWTETIIQTINYTKDIPNTDKNRIGIVGYSLGGTIALAVATMDPRVKALAINSGYLPAGFTKENAANLPNTLMISGTEDSAIHTLNQLKQWFIESGKPFQTKINEGIGHDNVPLNLFQEDWDAIVKFFEKDPYRRNAPSRIRVTETKPTETKSEESKPQQEESKSKDTTYLDTPDIIYLKNKNIVEGKVITQTDEQVTVEIDLPGGSATLNFDRKEIEKIEKRTEGK